MAIAALVITVAASIVPLKEYFKYNTDFAWWNEKDYQRVEHFNRIDFGDPGSDDYTFRQFGPDVPKSPVLFSGNALKYLPNTNRWILGARGEKSTAVFIGMVDRNKKFDFTSASGEYFEHNYVITTTNAIPIDASMFGDMLYAEINGIIVDSKLRFRVYLPDFSKYDEVTIDLKFD